MELISECFYIEMHLLFACCVILHFGFVITDTPHEKSKEDIDGEEEPHDEHTFVALIDIVFSDGSKRTCTGTIIHDNVVITAAHCFLHQFGDEIKPELTLSFVVIGTRKMFETGYEQYLPIERILTHPKFRAWTADLSLVYTFAGMTSDKPGRIITLAGEKTSNPVDSNVTIFSWRLSHGHHDGHNWHITMTTREFKTPCPDDTVEEYNDEFPHRVTVGVNSKRARGQGKFPVARERVSQQKPASRPQSRFQKETRQDTDLLHQYPLLQHKLRDKQMEEKPVKLIKRPATKRLSRYLPVDDDDKEETEHRKSHSEPKTSPYVPHVTDIGNVDAVLRSRHDTREALEYNYSLKSIYKNWRRHMGTLRNKLIVETFGFINLVACRKIVEGSSLPAIYEIKNGEVACYTNDEHYVTDEDSGAPAIRHGQLVAVTVGGAQSDGDHVAVGMKMSCYCSWIADNLPGGENINCCKNCCEAKNSEEKKTASKDKNKYLF